MKAYVFTGGEIYHQYIEERPEDGDLVISADAGYRNATLMGVHTNILIGDFDSLGHIPDDVDEVKQLPAEKDLTDTQIAVEIALEKGADEIVIVGSTSGRGRGVYQFYVAPGCSGCKCAGKRLCNNQ